MAAEKTPAVEGAPAKKGPPIVAIILAVAVIAFGSGFVVMKKMFGKPSKPASTAVVIGETVPLDEFLINLADTDSSHYVKATIALGLVQGKAAEEFKTKIPQARDAIVMTMSAKTLSEVDTTAGKEALKKELVASIDKEVGDKNVGAVYFEGFATQ
jgi:flagellar FliL protein